MKELKKASRQDDSLQLWHHSKLDSQFTQQTFPEKKGGKCGKQNENNQR